MRAWCNFYTASYLLVISSRNEVGDCEYTNNAVVSSDLRCVEVLDPRHTVYSVKGVTAVPLEEERARKVISSLASRNEIDRRASLLPSEVIQKDESIDDVAAANSTGDSATGDTKSPRVKFADENDVKLVSPRPDQSFDALEDERAASPTPSTASTPSSEQSTNGDPVIKTLANRLSFWSRLSKRSSRQMSVDQALLEQSGTEEIEPLNISMDGMKDPDAVISKILESAAPAPQTEEEKHSELEGKIIRECIREYSRGGMYFAYTFGRSSLNLCRMCTNAHTDITRSLQHKHELVAVAKSQNALLETLNALEESRRLSPVSDKVDVLVEPSAALPLWRRVDRQFWWNEWMSKPFIDTGVRRPLSST